MTYGNLLLILGSACMHVIVHVGLKKASDRTSFVWWMLVWAMVLFSPILVIFGRPLSPAAIGIMLLSSVFEAAYFLAIAKAYRGADLSVIYPLARGTAPALLLIWSALILREPISAGGIAGVITIAAGLYVINLPRLGAWREPLRSLRQNGPRWALLAGLSTSLYTAIDKVGITFVPPLLYTYIALGITILWVTPFTLREVGWSGLLDGLHAKRAQSGALIGLPVDDTAIGVVPCVELPFLVVNLGQLLEAVSPVMAEEPVMGAEERIERRGGYHYPASPGELLIGYPGEKRPVVGRVLYDIEQQYQVVRPASGREAVVVSYRAARL